MRSQHAIQKAKRKRQRRQRPSGTTGHTKTERKTFDTSILLVHGIGNQKPNGLIDNWGESIFEEIKHLSSQKGWECKPQTPNETAVISLTKNKKSYTISLSECIWSDKFKRPGRREMFSWILERLPALLFLLLPDSRDSEDLFDVDRNTLNNRSIINFIIRFLLLIGIISWIVCSINIVLRWAANRASHSIVEFTALAVSLTAITLLAIKFHSHWNLAGHVKVASELNSEEAEKITKFVQRKIEAVRLQSLSTTIVAHSQGGLLAHDALTHITGTAASHLHLFGVGSGIRPITLFRSLRKWPGVMFLWSWFLLALSIFPLLQILLYIPFVPQLLLVSLRLLTLVNLSLLVVREIPFSLWSSTLSQLSYPRFSDIFNLSSIPPTLVILFFISITGLAISSRKIKTDVKCIENIPDIDWTEITTPHDVVGRFAFPSLPSKVKQITVPSEGNPLLDHTRYFKKGALAPRIIAASVLSDLGVLTLEEGITRYESVSNSVLEITRKRWRVVSFISLGVTCPFIVAMATFPPSIALLVVTSMLFCIVSAPLRFGQYILNHLKQKSDIERATNNTNSILAPTSDPPYITVAPLLISSGLGFLGSFEWVLLAMGGLIPAAFTPFLFLVTSFIHFIWAALLASNYKPSNVTLLLVSTIPLLCLLFIDKTILWPEILPIGLLHSIAFLAASIFVWAAPCLKMFRTAKRADSISGT